MYYTVIFQTVISIDELENFLIISDNIFIFEYFNCQDLELSLVNIKKIIFNPSYAKFYFYAPRKHKTRGFLMFSVGYRNWTLT